MRSDQCLQLTFQALPGGFLSLLALSFSANYFLGLNGDSAHKVSTLIRWAGVGN
jgi:hypothetical protein